MDLKLRPLVIKDLEFLLEVRNHDSTRKYLENDSVFDLEQCTKWFKETKPKWYIILNEDNIKVGYLRTDGYDVGCDIHYDHRRKGYAKRAYQIYLKDKEYASLWVFEDNFAKKLYESLGFKETGNIKSIRNKQYIHMQYKK